MTTQNQQNNHKRPHLILETNGRAEPFRPFVGGSPSRLPRRDRNQHGHGLLRQLGGLHSQFKEARERQTEVGFEEGLNLKAFQILSLLLTP